MRDNVLKFTNRPRGLKAQPARIYTLRVVVRGPLGGPIAFTIEDTSPDAIEQTNPGMTVESVTVLASRPWTPPPPPPPAPRDPMAPRLVRR